MTIRYKLYQDGYEVGKEDPTVMLKEEGSLPGRVGDTLGLDTTTDGRLVITLDNGLRLEFSVSEWGTLKVVGMPN